MNHCFSKIFEYHTIQDVRIPFFLAPRLHPLWPSLTQRRKRKHNTHGISGHHREVCNSLSSAHASQSNANFKGSPKSSVQYGAGSYASRQGPSSRSRLGTKQYSTSATTTSRDTAPVQWQESSVPLRFVTVDQYNGQNRIMESPKVQQRSQSPHVVNESPNESAFQNDLKMLDRSLNWVQLKEKNDVPSGWKSHSYDTRLEGLELHEAPMNENALLQYAWYLAKRGDLAHALEAMSRAVSAGLPITSLGLHKLCSVLLRQAGKYHYQTTTDVVSTMLRHGIPLNIFHYNIMMLNAFAGGEMATGWRVHALLYQNHIKFDAYTYTILFKACRRSNRLHHFRKLYKRLHSENLTSSHPELVTEVLFSFCYFGKWTGYERVLRRYEIYCDLGPLRALGMLPAHYTHSQSFSASPPLPPPSRTTLVVMLLAYLRSAKLSQITQLYVNVFKSWQLRDVVLTPLAANRHFFHVMLKALGRTHVFRHKWRKIVGHMETLFVPPGRRQFDPIDELTGKPFTPCQTDIHTWNIILNAFSHREEMGLTRYVMQEMYKRGIQPDIITWNSLLSGYAKCQDVSRVLAILRTMKKQNLDVDQSTLAALSHLKARDRLLHDIQTDAMLTDAPAVLTEATSASLIQLPRVQDADFCHHVSDNDPRLTAEPLHADEPLQADEPSAEPQTSPPKYK